jgi:energy-coupling factor transporter ATP-binding protein EcfA2
MTVVVCGESGAGKTTLALALIAAGFLPYSDDVILLEPERLTPVAFERAFHVDATTRALVSTLDHDVEWEIPGLPPGYFLPRAWARRPLPVGALIFPRGRGLDRPLIVAMTVPEAATALLAASGSLDSDPALALKTAARLTAAAPAFSLISGPVPSTLALVQETIQRLVDTRASG